jgi:hypothetical protein
MLNFCALLMKKILYERHMHGFIINRLILSYSHEQYKTEYHEAVISGG